MRTCVLVLVGVLVMSQAAMAEIPPPLPGQGGQSPFDRFAGTGTVKQNATHVGGGNLNGLGWYVGSTSAIYVRHADAKDEFGNSVDYMYYRETWTTARDLGTLMVAAPGYIGNQSYGGASGELWVQREQGGEFTKLESFRFSVDPFTMDFFAVNQKNIYGVEIRVTDGTEPGYHQVGAIEFFTDSIENFANVAFGKDAFYSPGSKQRGSVTDGTYSASNDSFYGIAGQKEQYVGVDFGGDFLLKGLLINTCMYTGYEWENFDVQYRLGEYEDDSEGWIPWGRATADRTVGDMYWVSFGDGVEASQVRLYGSAAGGNDPAGKIINQIWAFGAPVPEPMTMTLLALGGLALLRRRT